MSKSTPTESELGYCDIVESVEIGGDRVTVFRQQEEGSQTATIVIRGGTRNHMDDIERAVDDGISVIKGLIKDPRLVAGAGGCEVELSCQLQDIAEVMVVLNASSSRSLLANRGSVAVRHQGLRRGI